MEIICFFLEKSKSNSKKIAKILKISVSIYTQYELGIILILKVYIYKLENNLIVLLMK